MRTKLGVLLFALAALGLGVGQPSAASEVDVGTDVGDRFPSLVLPSLADGRPLAISQFRGQKILLHQFASW